MSPAPCGLLAEVSRRRHTAPVTPLPVKFDSLTTQDTDPGRRKRLAVGYIGALIVLSGVLVAGAVFGGQIQARVLEEKVDVKLVKRVEAPPPPQPAKPPPPPKARKIAAHTGPAALGNATAPPKVIPHDLPTEGDPNKPREATEHHDGTGDPNGTRGGKGNGGLAVVPPPVAAPAPPTHEEAPPAPEVAPENPTPPVAIRKPMPAYPEEARKQGIEAVITVKFTVTEEGTVEDVAIVKGHDLFDAVVKAMVATWTFHPATLEGRPMRMRRLAKIPFRLRTQ